MGMQVTISKEEAVAGRVAQHVRELEKEVNVLKTLNHVNIVRYLVGSPAPNTPSPDPNTSLFASRLCTATLLTRSQQIRVGVW
jgi:hypothetical protein